MHMQGETSVASATSYPVWNEEISFIEQFPPLAQRIRIQILDDAKMGDIALATHFLDLQQISDHTRNGRSQFTLSGLSLCVLDRPLAYGNMHTICTW